MPPASHPNPGGAISNTDCMFLIYPQEHMRVKAYTGQEEAPPRKSQQGFIFTQSGLRDLTRPARRAGARQQPGERSGGREAADAQPATPEPQATRWGTELRHRVAIT